MSETKSQQKVMYTEIVNKTKPKTKIFMWKK